ncbi:MAG: sugar transferase [Peptococcaceae bacterium]|jgi:lipopolysaccharide/colanic/teichoic acid biosynthesis glycosyltransferase|nr:sugar transferase [Peptococcaceae bacterium]
MTYLGKRLFDIVGSVFALIAFSPLFILLSMLILITDGRPVFYRQKRIGKGGKTFRIIKFRSMYKDADKILKNNPTIYQKYLENDYKLPEGEDPRITKIGLFLRKTSLDELPQFFNVLKGDMSLVGPRPIVPEELQEYGEKKNKFLLMKPGITGIWQVSGRSELKYPERTEVELKYIQVQSFRFDLRVLFKTVNCVFKRQGAF